ncbi:unnamed protein product [Rhizopus stolonifer]
MDYILNKMPYEAVTDMVHKLSCIKQFMQHLDQSAVFSFCLKTKDQALKDIHVYYLFYSVLNMCEPSLEIWNKEFFNVKSSEAVILEFEKLLDAYLYLPNQKNRDDILKLIEFNQHLKNEMFSPRIRIFNTIHSHDIFPLVVSDMNVQPLMSIQKTLNELEKSQIQVYESEIALIENCLWNTERETEFYNSFCVFKKSSYVNLDEILFVLHLADQSTIVKLSLCLLCALDSEENIQDSSSVKDTIEMVWVRLYAKLLQDIFFENLPCSRSSSTHMLLKTAACFVTYRAKFGLKNVSVFQNTWEHFCMQRRIFLRSVTNSEDLNQAQEDMEFLKNTVLVSISSPILVS